MSQKALTKSTSQLIGETPETVTEAEMDESLVAAEMDNDLSATKVQARSKVGRFITQQRGGYLVAHTEIQIGYLERAAKVVLADVEDPKSNRSERVVAAEALAKLSNASSTQITAQIKAQEMVAVGSAKDSQKGRAPSQITGMEINAENVQIVTGPPAAQKAA